MFARILLTLVAAVLPALAQQASSASLTIHADRPGPQVNRQLFGQFAEHLGAGIYGGIWVGEDSKIPNTRGYRNDVLQALRELKVPVVRWPGAASPTSTTGGKAWVHDPSGRSRSTRIGAG